MPRCARQRAHLITSSAPAARLTAAASAPTADAVSAARPQHPAPGALRSQAAAARPADWQPVRQELARSELKHRVLADRELAHREQVVRLADAGHSPAAAAGANRDRASEFPWSATRARPRPEHRRIVVVVPAQAKGSPPAWRAAALHVRSHRAGGFRDRSHAPPAMTTAPQRRPYDRAHPAGRRQTVELPGGRSQFPATSKPDWRECPPGQRGYRIRLTRWRAHLRHRAWLRRHEAGRPEC